MKVGIIGFTRAGKTTVFNALTGATAAVGAFGSRDANMAVIKVPDARVAKLAEVFAPKKTTYAEFEFVDVAPNAAAGEEKALDAAALTALKNVDALVHVIRAFGNPNVLHPLESVDPARDCGALEEEIQFSDLLIIEKRLERLTKENKKDNEFALLERCRGHIESGAPLRTLEMNPQEFKLLQGFTFLSIKPLLIVGNYGEDDIGTEDPANLEACGEARGFSPIAFCGSMEMELAELTEEERAEFRADLELGEESRTLFIQRAYESLGLMSFLTAGDPEVRAWTIARDTKAPAAAGVIHSDIERGFIRAEVVDYDEFIVSGSMAKAKEQGKLRLEGKEYVLQDGDIVNFLFNV